MLCGLLQFGREMPIILSSLWPPYGHQFCVKHRPRWHCKSEIMCVCECYLRMARAAAVGLFIWNTKWLRHLLCCGVTGKCFFCECLCSCVISVFRSSVNEFSTLLACCAANAVSLDCPETSVPNWQSTLPNFQEEQKSHIGCFYRLTAEKYNKIRSNTHSTFWPYCCHLAI
jgi:hypothetical protein